MRVRYNHYLEDLKSMNLFRRRKGRKRFDTRGQIVLVIWFRIKIVLANSIYLFVCFLVYTCVVNFFFFKIAIDIK